MFMPGKVGLLVEMRLRENTLVYCARRHLRAEINILNPLAICFLGLNNLAPVTRSLFERQIDDVPVRASL